MVKPCIRCGSTERYKGGRCKKCKRENNRNWYEANPERKKEYNRNWYEANPERQRKNVRRWKLQAKYGLTEEQYHQMLIDQAGLCGSCDRQMDKTYEPHIDHDHKTGMVRELLCHRCNMGLGFLEDELFMKSGPVYLKRWSW